MSLSDRELARILQNPDITLVTDETGYTTIAPRRVARTYRITLDYPPSANRYWRVYNNRVVRSEEANAYAQSVGLICSTAGIVPLDGDVGVTLRVYRPQRSGDLDNRLKCCLDAMQGYGYHNDNQIVAIHATRYDDKDNPRVEIEIRPLGEK